MELNEQQLTDLQQELNYAVKYKETYDELYDHILTEIGTYPEQPFYATTAAKQIIDNEFGGYEALKQMEKDRVKLVTAVMRKKHLQHMLRFFNFPVAASTLIITIAAYFAAQNPVGRNYLIQITTGCAVVPMLFLLYKKLSAKYKQWKWNVYKKQSIKDNYIFIAALLSNSTFNLLIIENRKLLINGGIAMLVFAIYMVYVLSFFKLYRDEFKMQLT